MGFFNTVYNQPTITDKSWAGYFESMANVCRAPTQWAVAECCNSGNRQYLQFYKNMPDYAEPTDYRYEIRTMNHLQFKKDNECMHVIRAIIGAVICPFTYLLSIPLMGLAFTSKEIRLKHALTVRTLSPEEQLQLKRLVNIRQSEQTERSGEPVSCILCSICCLMCTLVCCKD